MRFSIRTQFSFLWLIDRSLYVATTAGQSEPGSDENGGVLRITQTSCITWLFSVISATCWWGSYPFAKKQSAQTDWPTHCWREKSWIQTTIYIYIYMCVCVWFCVWVHVWLKGADKEECIFFFVYEQANVISDRINFDIVRKIGRRFKRFCQSV